MQPKLIFFTLLLFLGASCTQKDIDDKTVDTLNIQKYMGKWFEIARFDHRFEHSLVGVVTEYSLLPNGDVQVINSGYWKSFAGEYKKAHGIAKRPDPLRPGHFRITFILWSYADYNILELDKNNYNYALVGSNTSDYLWLLSRTPTLPEETIQSLLKKAEQRGYDISRIKRVKQKE